MKKQLFLPLFLLSLLTLTLLQCGKKKEDPAPGGNNGTATLSISSVNPVSGGVGSKVVITGTGFSTTPANNTVKFGSIAAILDSATATRLVTKVPKDAVTGKITIEVGGKSATSNSDFSIVQAPPTFTGTSSTANVPVAVTTTTASIATTIDKEGSKTIIQYGHVWSSTKSEPVLNGRIAATEGKTELGAVPANATFPYKFTSDLQNLDPATTYNVRAYVTTKEGTTYGPTSQVQSKKPCLITSVSTPNSSTSFTFNNKYQLTAIKDNLQTSAFTYNADGFLTQFETKRDGNTTTESYEYTQGRLSKKENKRVLPSLTITTVTAYEYDSQGKLSKEIYTSGTTKIDYIFTQGVLSEARSNVAGLNYTVKDGNIIKYESATSVINYEYDAKGNRTKNEQIDKSKTPNSITLFQYKYDDKPNFKMAIYESLKGWLPYQLTTSEFYGSTNISGSSYNNITESVYQYTDTANQLVVNTQRYSYTYDKNRVLSYLNSFTQTVGGKTITNNQSVNYTHNYSGDCNN